jgi:hypothetical protein
MASLGLRPLFGIFFGSFKFVFATPVSALFDDDAGAFEFLFVVEKARAVEVDVDYVQTHGAVLGDLPGFVEVRPR